MTMAAPWVRDQSAAGFPAAADRRRRPLRLGLVVWAMTSITSQAALPISGSVVVRKDANCAQIDRDRGGPVAPADAGDKLGRGRR